jgi:hypothetical protein
VTGPKVSDEIYEQQMARALFLKAEGVSLRLIADEIGISRDTLSSRLRNRHGGAKRVQFDRKPKRGKWIDIDTPSPVEKVEAGPEEAGPLWSRARVLGVARRLKARWSIDHIASDLSAMPGPQVSPQDVLRWAGRLG